MWKYVSRGVRESLERGLGFSWSNTNRHDTASRQQSSKFTSFCQVASRARVCSLSKWPQCRSQQHTSSKSSPDNEEDPPKQNQQGTHFTEDPKECLLGAFSCSSALVLGWVLTQPYYHWRKWWSSNRCTLRSNCPLACSILSSRDPVLCHLRLYDPLSTFIRGLNISKLLPVSLAAPNTPVPVLLSSDHEERQPDVQYGPVTAEQALDEAADEVRLAHERALSISENRRGVDAASRHRHSKAISLFRSASARSYAPAMYNLAQCYELGLGTKQDFSKAAEWYERAAELGHAGSMYNLAVFHAHGWGGLEADPNKSRQLLLMAAEKGQPDAMAALGYPGQQQPPSITPMIEKEDFWTSPSSAVDIQQSSDDVTDDTDSYQHFSKNPIALYNLAQSFENNTNKDCRADPYLIMDLYQFASELGHSAAKARLQILQTYDAVGLLREFLFLNEDKRNDLCESEIIMQSN